VQAAKLGSPVVWTCDPMHGNTRVTASNMKTRDFDDILTELRHTFEVLQECGGHLGGVHFELTGENVTECTGGPQRLLEHDLPQRYTTYCDPRLNYAQGMELAFLIAEYLGNERELELSAESGLPPTAFAGNGGGTSEMFTVHSQAAVAPSDGPKDAADGGVSAGSGESKDDGEHSEGGSVGSLDANGKLTKRRFAAGRGLSPQLGPRAT
jgi:hypothetical protein